MLSLLEKVAGSSHTFSVPASLPKEVLRLQGEEAHTHTYYWFLGSVPGPSAGSGGTLVGFTGLLCPWLLVALPVSPALPEAGLIYEMFFQLGKVERTTFNFCFIHS